MTQRTMRTPSDTTETGDISTKKQFLVCMYVHTDVYLCTGSHMCARTTRAMHTHIQDTHAYVYAHICTRENMSIIFSFPTSYLCLCASRRHRGLLQ